MKTRKSYHFPIPGALNTLDPGVDLHAIDMWLKPITEEWVIQYRYDDETMWATTEPCYNSGMTTVMTIMVAAMDAGCLDLDPDHVASILVDKLGPSGYG